MLILNRKDHRRVNELNKSAVEKGAIWCGVPVGRTSQSGRALDRLKAKKGDLRERDLIAKVLIDRRQFD